MKRLKRLLKRYFTSISTQEAKESGLKPDIPYCIMIGRDDVWVDEKGRKYWVKE